MQTIINLELDSLSFDLKLTNPKLQHYYDNAFGKSRLRSYRFLIDQNRQNLESITSSKISLSEEDLLEKNLTLAEFKDEMTRIQETLDQDLEAINHPMYESILNETKQKRFKPHMDRFNSEVALLETKESKIGQQLDSTIKVLEARRESSIKEYQRFLNLRKLKDLNTKDFTVKEMRRASRLINDYPNAHSLPNSVLHKMDYLITRMVTHGVPTESEVEEIVRGYQKEFKSKWKTHEKALKTFTSEEINQHTNKITDLSFQTLIDVLGFGHIRDQKILQNRCPISDSDLPHPKFQKIDKALHSNDPNRFIEVYNTIKEYDQAHELPEEQKTKKLRTIETYILYQTLTKMINYERYFQAMQE